jgi:hypothetical protein
MADWNLEPPAKDPSSKGRRHTAPAQATGAQPAPVPPAPDRGEARAAATPAPAQPPHAPATSPTPSKPRRPRLPWARLPYAWLAVAFVVLLVGLMAGFSLARSQAAGDRAALADATARLSQAQAALSRSEDRNWTFYRTNEALQQQLEQATSPGPTASTTASTAGKKGTYSDGIYLVGEDIPVGTYDGAVTGNVGYWARLNATDGAIASIIDNGLPQGPFVLTIVEGDKAVELRGVTLTAR